MIGEFVYLLSCQPDGTVKVHQAKIVDINPSLTDSIENIYTIQFMDGKTHQIDPHSFYERSELLEEIECNFELLRKEKIWIWN